MSEIDALINRSINIPSARDRQQQNRYLWVAIPLAAVYVLRHWMAAILQGRLLQQEWILVKVLQHIHLNKDACSRDPTKLCDPLNGGPAKYFQQHCT